MNTFDLKNEIAQWRAQMNASDGISKGAIDELETHLCDQIDELESAGLSSEEAFLLARRRLGAMDSLDQDFARVAPGVVWRRRLFWMLIGYLNLSVLGLIISSIAQVGSLGALFSGSSPNFTWYGASYLVAILIALGLGFVGLKLLQNGKSYSLKFAWFTLGLFVLLKSFQPLMTVLVTQQFSVADYHQLAINASIGGIAFQVMILFCLCFGIAKLGKQVIPHRQAI